MKYWGCPSPSNYCLFPSEAVLVDNPNFFVTTNFGGNTRYLISSMSIGTSNETVSFQDFFTEVSIFAFIFVCVWFVLYIRR